VRYLAVDFGEARIGLATSDESGSLATPRGTIARRSDDQAVEEIRRFARDEEIGEVVLGLPHHGDGAESELAPRVRSFARKLQAGTSLPVHFLNEHLTTKEADSRFVRSADPDAAAAAVLLEEFLLRPR
jgi:putative Holliday junction resolvase